MGDLYKYNGAIIAKSGALASAQTCCCACPPGSNCISISTGGIVGPGNCTPTDSETCRITIPDSYTLPVKIKISGGVDDDLKIDGQTIESGLYPYTPNCNGAHGIGTHNGGTGYEKTINNRTFSITLVDNHGGNTGMNITICLDPDHEQNVCDPPTYTCGVQSWNCTSDGCVSVNSESGEFADLSACNSACLPSYGCTPDGCTPQTYVRQDPVTLETCQETCQQRYICDTYKGCDATGYATTGMNLTECQEICQIEAYNCVPGYGGGDGGCQPVYAGSGAYQNLEECQAVCLERAICDAYLGCENMGYGTSGNLFSNCAQDCQIQSYACTYDGCSGLYNNNAGYPSMTACNEVCLDRYTCVEHYGYLYCSYAGKNTTGMTQAECEEDCRFKSYNCVYYGCIGVRDTSGAYSSESNCYSACIENFVCYNYFDEYYCDWTGYQVNGQTYSACAANCPPPQMQMPLTAASSTKTADDLIKLFEQQNQRGVYRISADTTYVMPPRPTNPPITLTLEQQDPTGPGTFLSKTLEKIGIKSSPTCSCKARARTMNEKGNDWCAENVSMIVGWLREEAEKRKLPFVDIAGTLLVKRAISLSRAAKKKQAKNESTATDRADS